MHTRACEKRESGKQPLEYPKYCANEKPNLVSVALRNNLFVKWVVRFKRLIYISS